MTQQFRKNVVGDRCINNIGECCSSRGTGVDENKRGWRRERRESRDPGPAKRCYIFDWILATSGSVMSVVAVPYRVLGGPSSIFVEAIRTISTVSEPRGGTLHVNTQS